MSTQQDGQMRQRVIYIAGDDSNAWTASFYSAHDGAPPMLVIEAPDGGRWCQPMLFGYDNPFGLDGQILGVLMMGINDLQADPSDPLWIPITERVKQGEDTSGSTPDDGFSAESLATTPSPTVSNESCGKTVARTGDPCLLRATHGGHCRSRV